MLMVMTGQAECPQMVESCRCEGARRAAGFAKAGQSGGYICGRPPGASLLAGRGSDREWCVHMSGLKGAPNPHPFDLPRSISEA